MTRMRRDPRAIAALAFAGFGLLYMVVNAASLIDQRRALGQPIAAWQAWVLEGTSFAAWLARLLFEARKDVITYVSILAVFLLARRLVSGAETPSVEASAAALIELRDVSRVVMLRPEEIDWVSAAGNYVELHGSFGTELTRRTMADLEAELALQGFVRVHRSRLVRRAAIATTVTRQSGDFDITLRSGTVISGSRRFRQNLG